MKLYPAIISTYRDSNSELKSSDDYIRIRIPQFHGVKDDTNVSNGVKFCEDSSLPFASIQRDFSNKDFSASSFNDGDIVYVMLENDDINTPIITGYASRFTYTTDPEVAKANKFNYNGNWPIGNIGSFEDFPGANNIVQMARSQVGVHDDGNNLVKYNDEYWGKGTCGASHPWCCAFAWWVFNNTKINGESCKKYFYGGNKTALCPTLMDFYKKKGQFISSGFKAGDLVFFDWSKNKTAANHVEIVVEDQVGTTGKVRTVGGNVEKWQNGKRTDRYNWVLEQDRDMSLISGGARVTLPKEDSLITGTNEEQIFKFLTRGLNFGTVEKPKYLNTAAACGILANIEKESSFNPTDQCIDSNNKISYGLCQWNGGRYESLKSFCKKNNYVINSITGQMYYLKDELSDSYKTYKREVLNPLLNVANDVNGAASAAKTWCLYFEKPANKEKRAEERAEAAKIFWAKYG